MGPPAALAGPVSIPIPIPIPDPIPPLSRRVVLVMPTHADGRDPSLVEAELRNANLRRLGAETLRVNLGDHPELIPLLPPAGGIVIVGAKGTEAVLPWGTPAAPILAWLGTDPR